MTAAIRLPRALRRTPLLEAIFELRFQPNVPNAGDVLPGLLFEHFRAEYPSVEQTPMGTIPREMRDKDADFHYLPTHRLIGDASVIQAGDRVVSMVKLYPYPGWTRFREAILELLRNVGRTNLLRECERFSFRYLNIIPVGPTERPLSMLTVQTAWPGHDFSERGFRLRLERDAAGLTTVVQISTGASAKRGESAVSGLLVDVDTIRAGIQTGFWVNEATVLDAAHAVAKQTFYSLLADATLEALEPMYDPF